MASFDTKPPAVPAEVREAARLAKSYVTAREAVRAHNESAVHPGDRAAARYALHATEAEALRACLSEDLARRRARSALKEADAEDDWAGRILAQRVWIPLLAVELGDANAAEVAWTLGMRPAGHPDAARG